MSQLDAGDGPRETLLDDLAPGPQDFPGMPEVGPADGIEDGVHAVPGASVSPPGGARANGIET